MVRFFEDSTTKAIQGVGESRPDWSHDRGNPNQTERREADRRDIRERLRRSFTAEISRQVDRVAARFTMRGNARGGSGVPPQQANVAGIDIVRLRAGNASNMHEWRNGLLQQFGLL